MSKLLMVVGAVFALAGGTVAVAQVGGEDGPAGETHAAECAEVERPGGAFGECVSERASAFGRCVADAAKAGERKPVEACAELKPGAPETAANRGRSDSVEAKGNGAAKNPTTGLEKPPAVDGQEFGQQVAENAQQLGGAPEGAGNGAEKNPTTGLEKPPAQDGQEFGQQVSENAQQIGGKPDGAGSPEGAGPPG